MEQSQEFRFCSVAHRDCIWKTVFESFLYCIRKKNLNGLSSVPNAVAPVVSDLDALEESSQSSHPAVLGIDSESFILALSAQGHLL